MPHINGRRLLKIFKKTYPKIPVIILAGDIEVDTAVKCMKTGAMDYIVKPVEEEKLLAAIRQALVYINFENEKNESRKHLKILLPRMKKCRPSFTILKLLPISPARTHFWRNPRGSTFGHAG